MLCHQQLAILNINHYPFYGVDESIYPFVVYSLPWLDMAPDNAFDYDYETIRVRFEVFDEYPNIQNVFTIMKQLEQVFDINRPNFPGSSNNMRIVKSSLLNNFIDTLNKEGRNMFWRGTADYSFVCERVWTK